MPHDRKVVHFLREKLIHPVVWIVTYQTKGELICQLLIN